ncbi:hypothetical protein JL720_15644 [Aureococcus anophagefferens]|nr:hypothetical protein JL720_15644 [Aureococcus anophagefferens]
MIARPKISRNERPRRDSRSTESDGAFELDEFGAPRQRASSSSSVDDFSGERRSSGHSASRDSYGSPAPSKTDWGPARARATGRRGSASPEAPPDAVAVRRAPRRRSAVRVERRRRRARAGPARPAGPSRAGGSLPPRAAGAAVGAAPAAAAQQPAGPPRELAVLARRVEDPLDSPLPPGHRPVAEGRRKSETGLVADAEAIRRKSSFRLDAGDDDEFNRAYEDLSAPRPPRHAGVDEAGGSRVVRVSDPLITTDMVRRKSSLDALADAAAPAAADGEGL